VKKFTAAKETRRARKRGSRTQEINLAQGSTIKPERKRGNMFTYIGYPWIIKVRNGKVGGNYPINAETFDKIRPRILSLDEIKKFDTIPDSDAVQLHLRDGKIATFGLLVPPLLPEHILPEHSEVVEITVRQDTPADITTLTPDQEKQAKKRHQDLESYTRYNVMAFEQFAENLERSVLVVTFGDYVEPIWNSDDSKREKLRRMASRGGRVMGMLGTHQNGDTSGYVQTGFDLEQTKEIMWEVLDRQQGSGN